MQDKLSDLACSKYGSHVLDKVWAQSDLGHENKIVQQLVKDENTLKGNLYGRIILRNCGIDRLKTRGASWQEKQSSPSKKRKLFEKLFEETKESESVVKKKKKRSSTQMASEMESGSEKANNTTYSNQLSELGVSLGEGSIWSNTSTTEALNGTVSLTTLLLQLYFVTFPWLRTGLVYKQDALSDIQLDKVRPLMTPVCFMHFHSLSH